MSSYESFLKVAISAAKSSGSIILEKASKVHDFKLKSHAERDVVTEIDLLSEKNIRSIISKHFPDHNIIGEEGDDLEKNSDYTWLIDPLDGTLNYIYGLPFHCVTLALLYQSEIIVGVTYNSCMNEMYYAAKGTGAYLNKKKITISNNTTLNESLFFAEIPTLPIPSSIDYDKFFHFLNAQSRGVLRIGSTALAMAYTASGRADGFWTYQYKPWDIAAGIIIAKEAGAEISYTDLDKNADNKERMCIASNKNIYNDFLAKLHSRVTLLH